MRERPWKERLWNAFIFCLMVLVLVTCMLAVIRWAVDFVTWSTLDSGWAQTIGALIGLAIAIWVPAKQKKDADKAEEARRRDEQVRICMAFRDELIILRHHFDQRNVVEILRDAPDEIFDMEIPIPRKRFPVFNAMVGRLIDVDDTAIRRGVIQAYGTANGLIDVAAMNNRRLWAYTELGRDARCADNSVHEEELKFQRGELVKLRSQMRTIVVETIKRVEQVLPLLNEVAAQNGLE
jgi:hypothetical protein